MSRILFAPRCSGVLATTVRGCWHHHSGLLAFGIMPSGRWGRLPPLFTPSPPTCDGWVASCVRLTASIARMATCTPQGRDTSGTTHPLPGTSSTYCVGHPRNRWTGPVSPLVGLNRDARSKIGLYDLQFPACSSAPGERKCGQCWMSQTGATKLPLLFELRIAVPASYVNPASATRLCPGLTKAAPP